MVMECLAVEVGALPGAQYPIADSGVSHASCVGYFFFLHCESMHDAVDKLPRIDLQDGL